MERSPRCARKPLFNPSGDAARDLRLDKQVARMVSRCDLQIAQVGGLRIAAHAGNHGYWLRRERQPLFR